MFTPEDISKAESGETRSVNWLSEVMQKKSWSQNQSASISGGGGVGTFNLKLGHINESGLNDIEGSRKFSARFNTNVNIADKFVLLADFYAHRLQVNRLLANDDGHGLYQIAWRMNPTQQIYFESEYPDHYILHNNLNPLASINHGGPKNYLHDRSTINLRPKYFLNKNLNRDPRLASSIFGHGDMFYGERIDIYNPSSLKYFENQRSSKSGYWFKKFVDETDAFRSGGNMHFPLLRYAEVLLTYAEAKIMMNDIDDLAKDCINQLRRRAKLDMTLADVNLTSKTQQQWVELIRNERRTELAGEGLRYDDILRWRIAENVLNEPAMGHTRLVDG